MSTGKFYTLRELEKVTGLSRGYINQALTDGALNAELRMLGNRAHEKTVSKYVVSEKSLKTFMRSENIAPYRRIQVSTTPKTKAELTEVGERRKKLEDYAEAKRLGVSVSDYLKMVM